MQAVLTNTATFTLAAFLITGCGSNENAAPPTPPPVLVSIEPVRYQEATYYDEYPASVSALNLVELRPQVSGFITGVHFKDGDRVRKGQLLYAIDNQLYQANYQQAVAGLQVQQANMVKAQKDANRFHELDKHDAVAKQLVDNADAALEVSRKQVAAASANIKAVQTNVKYTKVYAPFDGVIGISTVKIGAAVTAGQTLLNTVSSDRELAVDFNIDQQEIYRFSNMLKMGRRAFDDSTFTLAFGQDVYPYPGKLALLDRTVDPRTGTIKARLIFPNRDNLLIAGMNGTVRVQSNRGKKSILIPYKAITEQLGELFVYVPADSNKVSQRRVMVGKQIAKDVIINEGLKPDDNIVVEGVQNLKEGTVVTTQQKAAAPQK